VDALNAPSSADATKSITHSYDMDFVIWNRRGMPEAETYLGIFLWKMTRVA
jgi:hypothetical protein